MPPFDLLWKHYPTGSSEEVKRFIGGGAGGAWVTNTCVIRVSHSFNEAGSPIPANYPGLTTTYGKNNKRYAFRVAEFKPYLDKAYKRPEINGTGRNDVHGKKGVIMFDVRGWSDATGHFDIWDGRNCAGSEYFDKAHAVHLWLCQ
ncbi:MAG: type VI secretion system amidase effector protein Tae4 [Nannocystaceae bacterium]|nr:type VI secretion system amidase effector protein Tae4 [bacterium]